ncbi:ABC transporter permease [Amnibacterium flavum]|uniref:ABC transporter permease n=1 Tax=Amnibacterium flavum TaxID=2173173 RepID=A0A2V1HU30_9MICO|nr:ABC transporter permease [Amnibacterium flavum]PVZ96083.1 ABC transporter permease [Amnibacterium flavum]
MTSAALITRSTARVRPTARRIVGVIALVVLAILVFYPQLFVIADPTSINVGQRFLPPSFAHPFGTDDAGRDIFSRMVLGARISIGCAIIVVVSAAAVGTVIGAIGGWIGGWFDTLLSKVTDVFLAFPYLVLAMAISAAVGRDLWSAVLALVIVWWPSYARMVRTVVRGQKGELYVKAARTLGASGSQILRWHVIPQTTEQLAVRMTLDVGYVLVSFTGLSFLGLGAQAPSPEWGLMIASAKNYVLNAWWYPFFPGLVILGVVSLCVWLGDGIGAVKTAKKGKAKR